MTAPTSGTAVVCGYDIRKDMPKARKHLGLCPQHDILFNALTVEEHMQVYTPDTGNYLVKAQFIKEEVKEMLQSLRLEDKKDVFPVKLSGGMRRRLCAGLALIGGSKLVIFDEPTAGIDPAARRVLWDLLLNYVDMGNVILLTSHSNFTKANIGRLQELTPLGDPPEGLYIATPSKEWPNIRRSLGNNSKPGLLPKKEKANTYKLTDEEKGLSVKLLPEDSEYPMYSRTGIFVA
ncbi:phospholipid-transporting ATPase ABCA3-like [Zophobas morio]|uniref:phospholipid-transporting ATPase ABCA3-like n=1 Tax=Zophobas morio TaxID=2755281 RepID=UPI00308394E1